MLSRAARGLSARLLVLTILFVLLGEVFIYVPSIARHRLVFLEERIDAARIAALAVEASPDGMVTEELRLALLDRAGVSAISIKRPGTRLLVLSDDMPMTIDATFDLREATPMGLIGHAADALQNGGERTIRVMGNAPGDPSDTVVDIVLPEAPLFASMLDYSGRILWLSIILAFVVAGLVYLSLHWLMVLPLGRMTDSLVSFRRAPEGRGCDRQGQRPARRDRLGPAGAASHAAACARSAPSARAARRRRRRRRQDQPRSSQHAGDRCRPDRSAGDGARSRGAEAGAAAGGRDRSSHHALHAHAEFCDGPAAGAPARVVRLGAAGR